MLDETTIRLTNHINTAQTTMWSANCVTTCVCPQQMQNVGPQHGMQGQQYGNGYGTQRGHGPMGMGNPNSAMTTMGMGSMSGGMNGMSPMNSMANMGMMGQHGSMMGGMGPGSMGPGSMPMNKMSMQRREPSSVTCLVVCGVPHSTECNKIRLVLRSINPKSVFRRNIKGMLLARLGSVSFGVWTTCNGAPSGYYLPLFKPAS
uniref:Uncharacterized protein n=1 Tax=Timema cristinae TaxID=61476 RepID=A0A7R9GRV4_TIMCR|nr:unnamed protein product [Timema cristinae]